MGSSYSYPDGPTDCRADPDCDPLVNNASNGGIIMLFAFWGLSICIFITYFVVRRFSTGSPEVLLSFVIYLNLLI